MVIRTCSDISVRGNICQKIRYDITSSIPVYYVYILKFINDKSMLWSSAIAQFFQNETNILYT